MRLALCCRRATYLTLVSTSRQRRCPARSRLRALCSSLDSWNLHGYTSFTEECHADSSWKDHPDGREEDRCQPGQGLSAVEAGSRRAWPVFLVCLLREPLHRREC